MLTASPQKKKSFLADLRSKLVGGSSHANSNASSSQPAIRLPDVEAELTRFMREPLIDWDDDAVDWWKRNRERYLLLAPVARRFLAAPATSVASEQLFSIAKLASLPPFPSYG